MPADRLGIFGFALVAMVLLAGGTIAAELRLAQAELERADYEVQWRRELAYVANGSHDRAGLVLHRGGDTFGEVTLLDPDTGAELRRLDTPTDHELASVTLDGDGEFIVTLWDHDVDDGAGFVALRSTGDDWTELARHGWGSGWTMRSHWTERGGIVLFAHRGPITELDVDVDVDTSHVLRQPLDDHGIPIGAPSSLFDGDLGASMTLGEDIVVLGSREIRNEHEWEPVLARFGRDGSTRWARDWPVRLFHGCSTVPTVPTLVAVDDLVCVRERRVDPVRCVAAANGTTRFEIDVESEAIGTDGAHLLIVVESERSVLEVQRHASDGALVDRLALIAPSNASAYPELDVIEIDPDGSIYATDDRHRRQLWKFSPAPPSSR